MPDYSLLITHVIAPVLLGGVANMVFVRWPGLAGWKRPIDGGRLAADGRRLLGPNKTWKGLLGMVGLTALAALLIDGLAALCGGPRAPLHAALLGALLGLAYALAELPNSYVKRRLGIAAGGTGRGWLGGAFVLVDQVDSVLGCLLIALALMPIGWLDAAGVVLLCGGLHLAVNRVLFGLRLKNQKT